MTEETHNPWHRLRREIVYTNPWIEVWHDDVVRPDGEQGIYGVVHPKTSAVGIVALDDDDRVLLVGQYRYTLDRYSWEIPEGGVRLDEDLLEGARRELIEETGFSASEWRELVRFSLSNSVTDETGALYLATGLEPGAAAPDATEVLQIRWSPFDEALEQVRSGELFDSMTQMGLLRVALDRTR